MECRYHRSVRPLNEHGTSSRTAAPTAIASVARQHDAGNVYCTRAAPPPPPPPLAIVKDVDAAGATAPPPAIAITQCSLPK